MFNIDLVFGDLKKRDKVIKTQIHAI